MGGNGSSCRTAHYWNSGSRWVQRIIVEPVTAMEINALEVYQQKNLDLHHSCIIVFHVLLMSRDEP